MNRLICDQDDNLTSKFDDTILTYIYYISSRRNNNIII